MNALSTVTHLSILRRLNRHNRSLNLINTVTQSAKAVSEATKSVSNNNTSRPYNKFKKSSKEYKANTPKESQIGNLIFSNKINPDTFGTLSDDWKLEQQLQAMPEEEDDVVEKGFLCNVEGRTKLTIKQYSTMIKTFTEQKKLALAIDVLETRMMKEDKVRPIPAYIFNLIIGACGDMGYTKKAFHIYKKMRDYGIDATGHTYNGLFNACANSPFPEDALQKALRLRATLVERGFLINKILYHSMIKAFGRCGDLETSFVLVDEMLEKKLVVTDETFNFLLQACVTDKNTGFRHALLVWRKMLDKRVRPNLYTFNLMLRCSRDCGLGDDETTNQVIQVLLQSGQKMTKPLQLSGPSENVLNNGKQMAVVETSICVPNLISRQPTLGHVVAINHITQPEHRLMLMGGQQGVLEIMNIYKVKPDIKTFTQLLDQLPSNLAAEEELLIAMKRNQVEIDIDFCNMLIKKRSLRNDYENAKGVLQLIHQHRLKPDIVTFGTLALTCDSLSRARQLLQDISSVGYRSNVEILGALLKKACYVRDCDYIIEIMKTLAEEELKPNDKFLSHLDNFFRFSNKALSTQKTDNTGVLTRDKYKKYCEYYRSWKRNIAPEELPHPWKQFEEIKPESEDIEILNSGKVKYTKEL